MNFVTVNTSAFNTLSDNYRKNLNIVSASQELKLCEFDALADMVVEHCIASGSWGEKFSFSSLQTLHEFFCENEIHNFCLPHNAQLVGNLISAVSNADKASFADVVCNKLLKRCDGFSYASFFEPVSMGETVAYVKNPLAEEAFDVFSIGFEDPRLKYATSIKKATQMVSDSVSDYCLLPLEESDGVRLTATSELLFREGLKINDVTTVIGPYGDADMKYALLSKHVRIPDSYDEEPWYFEFCVDADSNSGISDLILAAEYLGNSLHKINTMTFDTEESETKRFFVILKSESADFLPFLTYLKFFAADVCAVGIYKNLE